MQMFSAETRVHRTNLKRARQRLAAVADDAPEVEYLAANSAVTEARGWLEWHQRLDIDAGLYDHQTDEF